MLFCIATAATEERGSAWGGLRPPSPPTRNTRRCSRGLVVSGDEATLSDRLGALVESVHELVVTRKPHRTHEPDKISCYA
jgi:hypothetical protein